MPYTRGYEEDGFLKQLDITRESLEILSAEEVSNRGQLGFYFSVMYSKEQNKPLFCLPM